MSLLDFLTAGSAAAVLAAGAAAGAAAAGMAGLAAGAAGVAAAGAAAGVAAGAAAGAAAAGVAGLAGATVVCAKDMAEEATKTAAISVCLNMFSSFKGGKSATPFQRLIGPVR